jgi:hypothetical protein
VGRRGDAQLRHEVRPYTRVWAEANVGSSRPMRQLPLAVRESAPFALDFAAERVAVEAGKSVRLKVRLRRLWPDFKNSLTVRGLLVPGGCRMGDAEMAAGRGETTVVLDVPPNVRPGEYTLALLGQAQVPYSKDARAAQKPTTLVSQPSPPLTLVVLPPRK